MNIDHSKSSIPWHRDPRIRSVFFQIVVGIIFITLIATMANNVVDNMDQRGIVVGIDWIHKISPFAIGFSPFIPHTLGETSYLKIFFIAVQNTIYVSVFSMIGATILGLIIGILRLSPNWLLAKLASVYIEVFRNVPLLLWFFFWYVAVFLPGLPNLSNSINIADAIFINNEGLYLPKLMIDDAMAMLILVGFVIVAIVIAFKVAHWARKRQERENFPTVWVQLGVLVLLPFLGFMIVGVPVHMEPPEIGRFQLIGGINLSTSFFVCWFSLTTYTASFIAENVRGGIVSVSYGQTEAARSLGFKHNAILRLIVIPQAMRVIIPPTISQYLNLTKNSTLAVAIAYEEIASLWMGITLNVTGQALVIIATSILVFWLLSFLTSAILNWYNRRVQLTER